MNTFGLNAKLICGCLVLLVAIATVFGARVYVGCDDGIYVAEIDGIQSLLSFTIIQRTLNPVTGITHDPVTQDVYYVETNLGIFKSNVDGVVRVLEGDKKNGICFNNNTLYVTDTKMVTIDTIKTDGTDHRIIITSFAMGPRIPTGITVDAKDGHVFWADVQTVNKAALDGSGATTFISDISNWNAVAVDEDARVLYASTSNGYVGRIMKCDLVAYEQMDIYNQGRGIRGIAIFNSDEDWLLFVERYAGLKALPIGGGSGREFFTTITDLNCDEYYSIEVISDITPQMTTSELLESTPNPTTADHQSFTTEHPLSTESDTSINKNTTQTVIRSQPTTVLPATRHSASGDRFISVSESTRTPRIGNSTTLQPPSTTAGVPTISEYARTLLNGVTGSSENIYKDFSEFSQETKSDRKSVDENVLNAFDILASAFPSNVTLGVVYTDDILEVHVYSSGTTELLQVNVDDVASITINTEFLASSISMNNEIYITVIVLKNVSDLASEIQQETTSKDILMIGSALVSVNLFDDRGHLLTHTDPGDLQFEINFRMQAPLPGYTSTCMFWDNENSLWSDEGSFTDEDTGNEIQQICTYNHLTTFAVLFELSKETFIYSLVVKTLVTACTCVSILLLIFGLTCYAILWNRTRLDKQRLLIHINVMIAMSLAYVCNLLSGIAKANETACLAFTIMRYNMFVSMFCCMLTEAIHLYRMIVLVYGTEKNLSAVYIGIGFGLPILMTIITSVIGGEDLADQESCWLAEPYVLAFIGPVALILVINIVILGIVVYKTLKVAANDNDDTLRSVRIGLRSAVLLLPIVGGSWLIGPIANVHVSVVYTMDLISSLQGVYLVAVICYINSEVRDALTKEWNHRSGRVQNINLQNFNGQPEDDT